MISITAGLLVVASSPQWMMYDKWDEIYSDPEIDEQELDDVKNSDSVEQDIDEEQTTEIENIIRTGLQRSSFGNRALRSQRELIISICC
ncbi:hypothetical protein MP228_000513 [Amoeboaphelidium protococcarum]|nr:hypothetical protein MP228_000513 [Amoeboaphelidium protococcarum]